MIAAFTEPSREIVPIAASRRRSTGSCPVATASHRATRSASSCWQFEAQWKPFFNLSGIAGCVCCAAGGGPVPSYPLVGAVVINERRTPLPEPHGFHRSKEHVVGADRSHFHDAAIECDHRADENRATGVERRPIAGRKSVRAQDAGPPG